MTLDEVLSRIPMWYAGKRSVLLRSPPGTGKSTTLAAAAGLLSSVFNAAYGFVIVDATLLTPADAIGYLVPKHMPDGTTESVYTLPFYWRTAEGKLLSEYAGGIIVVEEIDKADIDIKKILGEACLSGRIGPHQLPKGWLVWMAGNRQQDRSGSTKELDHHINRRMEIPVDPHFGSFENYANKVNAMPLTISFAKKHQDLVFASEVPKVQGPWCTPRSLLGGVDTYIQSVMKYTKSKTLPDDSLLMEEVKGMIGSTAMDQYFIHAKLQYEVPGIEEITKDPAGARLPNDAAVQTLIAYNLSREVTPENAGAVITYVERMAKEFAVTFANATMKRKPTLVLIPVFRKWIEGNSALIFLINSN